MYSYLAANPGSDKVFAEGFQFSDQCEKKWIAIFVVQIGRNLGHNDTLVHLGYFK